MMDCLFLAEAVIERRIARDFGSLPFPLMNEALRRLDRLVMDRVASDPERASREMSEYNRQREEALRD